MMKRILLFLPLSFFASVCFASITEVPQTADGYLSEGEYAVLSVTLEGYEELYVTGGGGEIINVRDNGYLEVQSTSPPYEDEGGSGTWDGGIMDIKLYDNSELLYLGGITDEITVRDDAAAVLKGGTINYITIYHLSSWSSNVTIYCQYGYQKTAAGISGLWADGSSFDIDFINPTGIFAPYPTANYVNIEIVPEPTTLALVAFGSLLIQKRKRV